MESLNGTSVCHAHTHTHTHLTHTLTHSLSHTHTHSLSLSLTHTHTHTLSPPSLPPPPPQPLYLSLYTVKGYPVIDGALYLTNITFARFLYNTPSTTCPYNTFAIGNNPLSPDAIHPAILTGTSLLNCDTNSLVFFYDPNPGWITQEVCIYIYIAVPIQTGQHEPCKGECCPVWVLQQICWISLSNLHVGLHRLIQFPSTIVSYGTCRLPRDIQQN